MEAIGHLKRIKGIIGPLGECVVKDEFGQLVVQFEAFTLSEDQHEQIKVLAEEFTKSFADVTADLHSKRVYYFPFPKDATGNEYTAKDLLKHMRLNGLPCRSFR